MVVSFLFYSGYGIMESIKNKKDYMKSFFKKRILKLFITFALGIMVYILVNAIFHIKYSFLTTILAFTGITAIGNSNWFIFATFCLYFAVLISFNVFKKNHLNALLLCLICSLIYIYIYIFVRALLGMIGGIIPFCVLTWGCFFPIIKKASSMF